MRMVIIDRPAIITDADGNRGATLLRCTANDRFIAATVMAASIRLYSGVITAGTSVDLQLLKVDR